MLGDLGVCDGNPAGRLLALANDGTGTFVDATASLLPPYQDQTPEAIALADIDEDGDLDLVTGNPPLFCGGSGCDRDPPGPTHLLINRLRQLRTPRLPRLGHGYDIEVHARGGAPSAADFALPFLSSGRVRTVLPGIGTLGIDPAVLLPVPAVLIPQPAGVVTTTVTVPNDTALVGAEIYSQALVVRFPNGAHLTNVALDRILR